MTTPTNSDAKLRQDIEFIIHPANKDGLASMQDDVIAIATAWRDRCVAEVSWKARLDELEIMELILTPTQVLTPQECLRLRITEIKRNIAALSPTTGEGTE